MTKKQKETVNPETSAPRRNFLSWIWTGLGLAALAEMVWVAASFLSPSKDRAPNSEVETILVAGPVDAFTPGTVTAFPRGRFYLARLADGGFLALSRRCTHLGCTVPWVEAEKRFLCPCHSSAFDMQGDVLHSPATRALDIFPVTIENEVVKVATGQAIKRYRFKPEQVAYPEKASFK